MKPSLSIKIGRMELHNPTILAAGILGITGKLLVGVAKAGAGAVTTKSIGSEPRDGFKNPTVVRVQSGLLNAMGLPNPGVEAFRKELEEVKKTIGVPVIASIFGFSPDEFATVASKMEDAGVDAIELNVSCPHVYAVGRQIGQNPDLVAKTVKRVKDQVDLEVLTKLSPNVTDIVEIAKAAEKAGTDAIVAINTVRGMKIDIETGRPILSAGIGGLSGPAIKPIAVKSVYEICKTVQVPVIGCGGIQNWEDAVEFILAGATAVEIGTAIMDRGLQVFSRISAGIESYLLQKGCSEVSEIVGRTHSY
ncbi:dihydroorotate dehydrogenase [Candidatus Bathyarchaeota archaeon]|nr:dihydroorotate dehydrogenase [Candidatus Bathyarchaeota archaeon]